MKQAVSIFLLCLLGLLTGRASERPNIVLILSDDQGWTDYGFMGHEDIRTPHLDALAEDSLLFERGYVPTPLCRPSLASIITGLYPHQHEITGNDVRPNRKMERHADDRPFVERFHEKPSLVRTLVEDGYLAFQSGKWWEGSWEDGCFTHGMTHGDPMKGGRHGDVGLRIGRDGMAPVTKFIDYSLEEEKPFFVWYAPFLPHTPHNPPEELLTPYVEAGHAPELAKYYAMCEWFDQTCGELLGHLEAHEIQDNTIVVYVCDNGWAWKPAADRSEDWFMLYAPRSKGSPFELGIRTPIMISWPGRVEALRNTNDLASSLDLMPTLLKACGLEPPEDLPGIDLLDAETVETRDAIFGSSYAIQDMIPHDPGATLQYRWVIQGDWKLLLRHQGQDTTRYQVVHAWDEAPHRLYNLKEDPHETTDLSDQNPEIIQQLTRLIDQNIPSS